MAVDLKVKSKIRKKTNFLIKWFEKLLGIFKYASSANNISLVNHPFAPASPKARIDYDFLYRL